MLCVVKYSRLIHVCIKILGLHYTVLQLSLFSSSLVFICTLAFLTGFGCETGRDRTSIYLRFHHAFQVPVLLQHISFFSTTTRHRMFAIYQLRPFWHFTLRFRHTEYNTSQWVYLLHQFSFIVSFHLMFHRSADLSSHAPVL